MRSCLGEGWTSSTPTMSALSAKLCAITPAHELFDRQ